MKKIFITICVLVLMLPFNVFANDKVYVYLFYGDSCSPCEEADMFFKSLDSSYQEKFMVDKLEIWNDKTSRDMMNTIATMRNDNVSEYPYIIIGDKSWIGYTSAMNDELKHQIDSEYQIDSSHRYDVMDEVLDYLDSDAYVFDDDSDDDSDQVYSDFEIDGPSSPSDYLTYYYPIGIGLLILSFFIIVGLILLIIALAKSYKKKGY